MSKEVRRVVNAIDAMEKIPDAGARAQALGELLREFPEMQKRAREMRQQAVIVMRQQGMTWQQIGDVLGVHRQRARQIADGTSWKRSDPAGDAGSDAGEGAGTPAG